MDDLTCKPHALAISVADSLHFYETNNAIVIRTLHYSDPSALQDMIQMSDATTPFSSLIRHIH